MKKPIPFGKYYLLERINVGGMAEVFKAKTFGVEGFERMLAVKRILPNIAEDEEFITMFIDEAKISVQLNHANIAQIFDLGKVDDSYFIALEFIHGKDVRSIFDRCRASGENMPIAQACFIIMKVCEGLDYAHNKRDAAGRELGLVHRDVSPQNVLLSYEGEVKIIDFGIAKAAGKASKTQAGILKGKFGYMSPEQVRGLPLDRRSDIFSVGIILYELLTGERLFIGESDFSTLEKVRNVEILPPSTYNRKIPEELERIVLKALTKDPDDRYLNSIDLHDELQAFMYTAGEFYSRKDLAAWMKRTFAREIQDESKKLEEYRHLKAPPPAGREPAPPPPPSHADGGRRQAAAAASVSSPVPIGAPDLDWDDDEIETQLYDKDDVTAPPPPGLPGPAPASASPGIGIPPPGQKRGAQALRKTLMGIGSPGAAASGRPAPPPAEVVEEEDPFAAAMAAAPAAAAQSARPAGGSRAEIDADLDPMPRVSDDLAPRKRKAKPSGAGARIALVAVASLLFLAASGAGLWYFLLREKPKGTLHIKVTQPGALVRVDDESAEKSAPVTVELSPGPHKLTIRKDGFKTVIKDVEVKAGKESELELSLQPIAQTQGTFDVVSLPKGADVFLDGKPLDAKTDINVKVAVGSHTIQLRKMGFHPWPPEGPQSLEVKEGANPEIRQVLIPLRLQLVISAANAKSAEFAVYKDGAKILSGAVPRTVAIKDIDPRANYRVTITAPGRPAWQKKIAFEGTDEIAVHAPFSGTDVADGMDPPPEMVEPMVMDPDPPPRDMSVYVPPRPRDPMVDPPMDRDPPPPRDTGGKGILRINTKPFPTQLYVDGKLYGWTPQLKVELSAGRHKIVLINNEQAIRKTIWVEIQPKATKTVIEDVSK